MAIVTFRDSASNSPEKGNVNMVNDEIKEMMYKNNSEWIIIIAEPNFDRTYLISLFRCGNRPPHQKIV